MKAGSPFMSSLLPQKRLALKNKSISSDPLHIVPPLGKLLTHGVVNPGTRLGHRIDSHVNQGGDPYFVPQNASVEVMVLILEVDRTELHMTAFSGTNT